MVNTSITIYIKKNKVEEKEINRRYNFRCFTIENDRLCFTVNKPYRKRINGVADTTEVYDALNVMI